jgi:hypothetical protein
MSETSFAESPGGDHVETNRPTSSGKAGDSSPLRPHPMSPTSNEEGLMPSHGKLTENRAESKANHG